MIKKIGFVFLVVLLILVGIAVANTAFDQEMKPEVKAVLANPPPFEGACAEARYAIVGFGNPDPVAAGKMIVEAMKKPEATGPQSELERLGFKKVWFPETQTTLNATDFDAVSAIFDRGAYCEVPPASLALLRLGFMRTADVLPRYLATLGERAQQEGAVWFWKKVETMVKFERAVVFSETAFVNQMVTLSNLEKATEWLKANAMNRPFLAKAVPPAIAPMLDMRASFKEIAEAGERFELRSVTEMFREDRVKLALEDEIADLQTTYLRRFLYRPVQTANEHWDWAQRLIESCNRPEPICIGELNSFDASFSLLNPFGHMVIRSFGATGNMFGAMKVKLERIAENAKALTSSP